jgi:ubiquinone biosynthesis protein
MISGIGNIRGSVRRVDEIVRVLAKYGLADWLGDRGPSIVRQRFLTPGGQSVTELPVAVRLRLALTELGTTFIKLGQMMSTRPDMIGPEMAQELETLQADTPADLPEAVRATLEAELGAPAEQFFASFDYDALASASVGQVHLAQLLDGTPVVVKVQHAGIEEKVRSDLSLMAAVAQLAENNSREIGYYRPSATVAEFRRSLLRELDFRTELNNLLQFAAMFEDDPEVHFPRAYPDLSGKRVLTMERLDGYSIAQTGRMKADGIDTVHLGDLFAGTMLEMIFKHGFYHADPHPGNVFVLRGGRLGMLDCGKTGRVDEQTQDDFITIVTAFVGRDVIGLTDELLRLCEVPPDLDRAAYQADVAEFVAEYADPPGGKLDLGGAFTSMFAIIRKHHLIVPPRVNMLLLVVVQTEGTARNLNPDFDLTAALRDYGAGLLRRRFGLQRLQRAALRSSRDWARLLNALPRETLDLIERTTRGDLTVNVNQRGLEGPINRLAYAVMVGALLLGSALLWAMDAPPTLWGVSVFGALGVLLGLWLGALVVIAIWRSGIRK